MVVIFLSTNMEDSVDKGNMSFSCGVDRIVEEFNAEQLHQVVRLLMLS